MAEGEGTVNEGGATGSTNAGANEGSQNESFITTLPEDLRANEALKAFDSAEKLARAHLEIMGKQPVVPETADAYEIKVPDGHPANPEFIAAFKQWSKDTGLTQEQAAKLAEGYIALEQAEIAKIQAGDKKAMEDLKAEWGDKFQEQWALADKAVLQFCTDAEQKYLLDSGLRNAGPLVKMFARIGKAMSEDELGKGAGAGGAGEMERSAGGVPMLDFPSMRTKKE